MGKITVEAMIRSDVKKVWAAWTTPADINQWNAASDDWHTPRSSNDLRVGGMFSYRMEARDGSAGFNFEGRYTTIEHEKRIEYVTEDGRAVSIIFTPTEGGTKIIETFDVENIHPPEMQRQGWQSILNRFCSYVEASK